MNLAIEFYICAAVTAAINNALDADILADCPAVSFTDQMSLDLAHRIVTFCPTTQNQPHHAGRFTADVQTMVKSQWTMPDYAADVSAHFDRVNQVRNLLLAPDLSDRIAAEADATKIGIDSCNSAQAWTTNIDTENNWITSEVQFTVVCHLPA